MGRLEWSSAWNEKGLSVPSKGADRGRCSWNSGVCSIWVGPWNRTCEVQKSFEFRVSSFELRTWHLEPGTWNSEAVPRTSHLALRTIWQLFCCLECCPRWVSRP